MIFGSTVGSDNDAPLPPLPAICVRSLRHAWFDTPAAWLGWRVGWFVDLLVDWLVTWSIGWLLARLVGWFVRYVSLSIDRLPPSFPRSLLPSLPRCLLPFLARSLPPSFPPYLPIRVFPGFDSLLLRSSLERWSRG